MDVCSRNDGKENILCEIICTFNGGSSSSTCLLYISQVGTEPLGIKMCVLTPFHVSLFLVPFGCIHVGIVMLIMSRGASYLA